ncbi:MAG: hypothetical protein V4710_04655 [Verrucomicrobiota bacterium]
MHLNYLPLYSGAVAVISIIVTVVLSRRGWSLFRGSLVLLALAMGLSTVGVLGLSFSLVLDFTFQLAAHIDVRFVRWFQYIYVIAGIASAGFLAACVAVFAAAACVTAFLQARDRKSKSSITQSP